MLVSSEPKKFKEFTYDIKISSLTLSWDLKFSHCAIFKDYTICIRPDIGMASGVTLRAQTFKMPVTG